MCSLLAASPVHAQDVAARIEGRVSVRTSDIPVPGATVEIEGTTLFARTDSLGRYVILRVPAGPQVLLVRRLGYAPSRVTANVAATGMLTLNVLMATSALKLDQLIVTADRSGRAKGELGTASVIDRNAIANQITSSLQGVLELIPGVPLQPPGLDASSQFSLRALAQLSTTTTGGVAGPSAADIAASGTLIVLDGVPLSNNANMQSVGVRGEVVPTASTAGGGIDLRRIPAATLERVEVIRGIPSARWGDLTQGAIIVDTRASATPPEITARYDPRTSEGNIVGGRAFQNERQQLTATGNLAQTALSRTLSSAVTTRGASQIAHRISFGIAPEQPRNADGRAPLPKLTLDTRLDWWQLKYESPERLDVEAGRSSFQDDHGLRLGERARLALGGGQLEWTLAYDVQSQSTAEARNLSRPTTPFTDRLTEGRNIGSFIEGIYNASYQLLGAPHLLYTRLEWDRSTTGTGRVAQLRLGSEVRREWNSGDGYVFPISKPPQVSQFNGTAGYDRPTRFSDTPAMATSAFYADTRVAVKRGEWIAELQPGVRLEALHEAGSIAGGVRSAQLQPRLSAQLTPRPWLRLRAGIGTVSKSPTISQLSPAPQYYDLVNVNRFTPDPRERLAVVTTFIKDPTNSALGLSRANKREAGFELDGGAQRGAISVTWFNDIIHGAVTTRRDPQPLQRARYNLADTGRGTGQPGRIIDPPAYYEPVPVFLERFVNSGTLGSKGYEAIVTLPVIPQLHTRLEVSGASLTTRFSTDDRDYGSPLSMSDFQVDTSIKRIAYFDRSSSESKRAIVTWRLVHQQPDVGLIITATIQQRLGDSRQVLSRSDSLAFVGYIDRAGTLTPVLESDKLKPEFADLRKRRPAVGSGTSTSPDDWVMSLQVAKSLGQTGRLSFYVFNVTDKFFTFGSSGVVRSLPSTRFGAELTIPTAELFGGAK